MSQQPWGWALIFSAREANRMRGDSGFPLRQEVPWGSLSGFVKSRLTTGPVNSLALAMTP